MQAKATIFDVAFHITKKLKNCTPMKLQKLCYYAQSWSLAWDDAPLFDQDFEAWVHGPVNPELFNALKGLFEITPEILEPKISGYKFNRTQLETINQIIKDYGKKALII